MTRDKKLETIRQRYKNANPNHPAHNQGGKSTHSLADMLLVIWKAGTIGEFSQVVVMGASEPRRLIEIWDLLKDDVAEQSDEVLDLILGAHTE